MIFANGDADMRTIIYIVSALLGTGGGAKAVQWIRRFQKLPDEVARLRKELNQNAVDIAVMLGWIEADEQVCFSQTEDGRAVYVSPALCQIMGVSAEEALDGAWRDAVAPDDRPRVLAAWDSFIKSGRTLWALNFRYQRPNGDLVPVRVKLIRKKIAEGGVPRIAGVVTQTGPVIRQPSPTGGLPGSGDSSKGTGSSSPDAPPPSGSSGK